MIIENIKKNPWPVYQTILNKNEHVASFSKRGGGNKKSEGRGKRQVSPPPKNIVHKTDVPY